MAGVPRDGVGDFQSVDVPTTTLLMMKARVLGLLRVQNSRHTF